MLCCTVVVPSALVNGWRIGRCTSWMESIMRNVSRKKRKRAKEEWDEAGGNCGGVRKRRQTESRLLESPATSELLLTREHHVGEFGGEGFALGVHVEDDFLLDIHAGRHGEDMARDGSEPVVHHVFRGGVEMPELL